MNNISSLFENLMTYSETSEKSGVAKKIDESDQTLLNLTVEIPKDLDDITPEDVNVEVGVMEIDDEDAEKEEVSEETPENEEESNEDEIDITPENEEAPAEDGSEETEVEAEESLKLENKCDKEDEDCDSKTEDLNEKSVDTAKSNIYKRVNAKNENIDEENDVILDEKKDVETDNEKCDKCIKNESLMRLDTKSLNRLFTEFVRENYKNIDKVVITKAILENRGLTLKGYIANLEGKKESIVLTNRGFDSTKLENTRFLIDFKDMSETFNVIKESLKKPFVFTATLKENILTFEELKYSFKTMHESKVAMIYGNCTLNESLEVKNENADQVKKFNEIVDKIKNAKTTDDLAKCKDEMDDSNIGDTLLSAAQMVWDDVNSRLNG